MGSPSVTPFIPPLSTPEGRSSPVIPASVGGTPAWRNQPQMQGYYPMYPPTPYNATPFIPQMSVHGTPAAPPGSYFPPPTNLPPTGPPPNHGLSGDYTGYPQFTTPGQPWGHPAMFAQTPAWGPPAAGPPPPAWGGPAGYPPFFPPAGHGPGHGPGPQGMGGMPPGWGPAPPFHHTPAAGFGGAPLWPPGWPPAGQPPAAQENRLPHGERGYDNISHFAIGKHYGPVLEPFLVSVVRADIRINPILLPPPDDSDRVHLKWNMLFSSSHCLRSNDPPHRSWTNGRGEPATFPRVTHIRIVSKAFPWMINIYARDKSVGVTCAEVIDGIADYLQKLSRGDEYKSLTRARQKAIKEAYNHNRAPAHGVPGGVLGEGLRRLDWLCQETMFGGIERKDSFVRIHCGDVLPCTFVLNCIHRYPLTEREIQEQAQREQSQRERPVSRDRERARDRRRSRVEAEDDDDTDDS